MQKLINYFILFTTVICASSTLLQGEIRGRVDVGPVYAAIDILESGKTVETLYMKGVKGDANILVYQGLTIKPSFIWTSGHGELTSGTIALGYYIPITPKFSILPNFGMTWSYLHTKVSFEELGLFHLKERFRSESPFLGLDVSYSITEKLTIIAMYQYAWSHTHTKITDLGGSKSHSCGPNYSLGLDYSLNKHWSITLGAGYNITLSKEKHGLRGKGIKLGVAYYF